MININGKAKIILGETFTRVFKFRKNSGVDQIDLSTASAITFYFQKNDDTWHSETLAGGGVARVTGTIGDLSVTMTTAETAVLKVGDSQNVEVTWVIGSATTKMVLERVLNVVDPGHTVA
jgi:hypothetical protein